MAKDDLEFGKRSHSDIYRHRNGCSQNYVSDLERGLCGKRLSYELGKKLEILWKENCSTQLTA
jgi:hypothetical protein